MAGRKQKSVEARLKGVLVCEIVVIVALSVWLGFTGGFEDLFRKDGEGVEPTAGRLISTCSSNGLIVLGNGEGAGCGVLGMMTNADSAPKVNSVKMADKDAESVKEAYASITENMERGDDDGTIGRFG